MKTSRSSPRPTRLPEWQIKEIETDGEPGNAQQEEKFFEAWRVALDEIGIDLNDIEVSIR